MFVRINLRNNDFILNMCKRIRKLLIHRRQSLTMSTPTQTLTSIHAVHRAMQQRQRARTRTYQGAKNSTRAGFPESTMASKLEGVRSITLLARTDCAVRAIERRSDEVRILGLFVEGELRVGGLDRAWHFERLEISNPGGQGDHSRLSRAIIRVPLLFWRLTFWRSSFE